MSSKPFIKAERKKPVKLQVNTRGSWANLIDFDADNDLASAHAVDAAETLGKLHHGGISFRVVTDEQPPLALMRWTQKDGWKKVAHHE